MADNPTPTCRSCEAWLKAKGHKCALHATAPTPTPQQSGDAELDNLLYAFADYIKHHERTGLGGPNHQGTTKKALLAWRDAAIEQAKLDAWEEAVMLVHGRHSITCALCYGELALAQLTESKS